MAWYKTGTVSVVDSSTSVTGDLTKFASNARVGDGFRGPDGRWYEIVNIASETVLGIYPPYQGGSVTGTVNWMIAPLQGYNKESADRLRAITDNISSVIESIGNKQDKNVRLTALANADFTASSIPVYLSNTQAVPSTVSTLGLNLIRDASPLEMRNRLQLGTGATLNYGLNTGDLMRVGAFGIGGTYSEMSTLTDMSGDQVSRVGIYRYTSDTAGRPPYGSGFGTIIAIPVVSADGNYAAQIAVDYASTEMAIRRLSGPAGWSAWVKVYHTGNTTKSSDGTLKAN